jgi:hypothetical protein
MRVALLRNNQPIFALQRTFTKQAAKAKANLVIVFVIMTVAGQKNHYNVKLLKGYEVSINLKGSRLCLKGGRDSFTGRQETEE